MTLESPTSRATALPATSTRRRRWPARCSRGRPGRRRAHGGGSGRSSRYVSGFWLYRGFAPASTPHSVVVKTASGTRRVAVAMPSIQDYSVGQPRCFPVTATRYKWSCHRATLRIRTSGTQSSTCCTGSRGCHRRLLNIGRGCLHRGNARRPGQDEAADPGHAQRHPLVPDRHRVGERHRSGQRRAMFVARDLVHAIDSRYRTIASGAARGIGGLSEGGYGALNIGLHNPGQFGLLEERSGYMMAYHLRSVFGAGTSLLGYNSPAVWSLGIRPGPGASHHIWFDSGICHRSPRRTARSPPNSVRWASLTTSTPCPEDIPGPVAQPDGAGPYHRIGAPATCSIGYAYLPSPPCGCSPPCSRP